MLGRRPRATLSPMEKERARVGQRPFDPRLYVLETRKRAMDVARHGGDGKEHVMSTTMDTTKAEGFGERMLGAFNDAALILLTSLGQRTGLFDTLAELPPSTSSEIAEATGLQERYVREWLGGMVVSEVIEYDPADRTYNLPAEHAAALTRAAGPNNLAGVAAYVPVVASVEGEVARCFRDGGGVPYSAYPRLQEVMREDTGAVADATL